MKCKKHAPYKGIKKPTTDCWACWCVYIQNHFFEHKEVLTMDEMENLIEMMGCEIHTEQLLDRLKLSD